MLDPTTDPCADFYQYACGGWLASDPMPPNQSYWMRGISGVWWDTRSRMRELLEARRRDDDPGPVGRYYRACMDEDGGTQGLATLEARLQDIRVPRSRREFMGMSGAALRLGARAPFRLAVDVDRRDPTVRAAFLSPAGLGLPDRTLYLDDTDSARELLDAYRTHVAAMLVRMGADPKTAQRNATAIVALETDIARIHVDRAKLRNADATDNPYDVEGLEREFRSLHWHEFLEGTGHPDLSTLVVTVPSFVSALDPVLSGYGPATLQAYLRWHVIRASAEHVPELAAEHFAFYGARLQGRSEQEERWQRCVSATTRALPDLTSRAYVERFFREERRTSARTLLTRIKDAFRRRLDRVPWMDDPTHRAAVQKLEAVRDYVGYPEVWPTHVVPPLDPSNNLVNVFATRGADFDRELASAGRRVDPTEWDVPPAEVNAYYSEANAMWFPAGILQPPFFGETRPPAVNFATMGAAMGHELTHGFDDQGRKFDPVGRRASWWSDASRRAFEERTTCVEALYSRQEVEPGLTLDGELVLGEAIADLAGLSLALDAFRAWEVDHADAAATPVANFSAEQLFFVSHAQLWCTVQTPEFLRIWVKTDPHPPSSYRINLTMSNTPAFAEAFQCAAGTPMNPTTRCSVW